MRLGGFIDNFLLFRRFYFSEKTLTTRCAASPSQGRLFYWVPSQSFPEGPVSRHPNPLSNGESPWPSLRLSDNNVSVSECMKPLSRDNQYTITDYHYGLLLRTVIGRRGLRIRGPRRLHMHALAVLRWKGIIIVFFQSSPEKNMGCNEAVTAPGRKRDSSRLL